MLRVTESPSAALAGERVAVPPVAWFSVTLYEGAYRYTGVTVTSSAGMTNDEFCVVALPVAHVTEEGVTSHRTKL